MKSLVIYSLAAAVLATAGQVLLLLHLLGSKWRAYQKAPTARCCGDLGENTCLRTIRCGPSP